MAEPAWLPLTGIRTPLARGTGMLEMTTLDIPCACTCSWSVVRPGPGRECRSRLSHPNNACPYRAQHDRMMKEARR